MNEVSVNGGPSPASRIRAHRALVTCGLWARAGFVFASLAASALALWVGGHAATAPTLAAVIGGGVAAVLAWRHAHAVLERADVAEKPAPTGSWPVVTGFSTGY